MARKSNGIGQEGFARIAGVAKRQKAREAIRRRSFSEPTALKLASKHAVAKEFEPLPDGRVVHKLSHRVWEMKALEDGTFELIRAQSELEDLPEEQPAEEPQPLSARLAKAAARGAQFLPAPEGGPSMPMDAQDECPDCNPESGDLCWRCEEAEMLEQEGQAPPAPPAPAPAPAAPASMLASLDDIKASPEDKKTASFTRGAAILVKVGKRTLSGKILAKADETLDVLLSNGATSRVSYDLVSLPGAKKAEAPKVMEPKPAPGDKKADAPKVEKQAVDPKAKAYWDAYWGEYGRQLVKSDLPRAVTDHAEPATPKSKQKPPTKKVKEGSVVDIGNLWLTDGSTLRTGVVRVVSMTKDRVSVVDPFGGKMGVPRKAVLSVRSEADFRRLRAKGTPANKAALLQAASSALSWKQLASRYPKAAFRFSDVKKAVAKGIRIALAGGYVPPSPGLDGRLAARAEFVKGLNKKALDEKAKEYYRAYYGDYGEDLVKEIKRRIKSDIINRASGALKRAQAPAMPPAAPPPAAPPPPPDVPVAAAEEDMAPTLPGEQAPGLLETQVAAALTAHVGGIMKSEKKVGNYTIDPKSVHVAKKASGTVAGTFKGVFKSAKREVTSEQSFELAVADGKVKAVKIS